jgi:hypothetical protein
MEPVQIKALVAYGRVGFDLVASRALSLLSMACTFALAAGVVYNPTWQGAAVVGIVAALVFYPALSVDAKRAKPDTPESE